jgi:hypothetical protein
MEQEHFEYFADAQILYAVSFAVFKGGTEPIFQVGPLAKKLVADGELGFESVKVKSSVGIGGITQFGNLISNLNRKIRNPPVGHYFFQVHQRAKAAFCSGNFLAKFPCSFLKLFLSGHFILYKG